MKNWQLIRQLPHLQANLCCTLVNQLAEGLGGATAFSPLTV